MVELLASTQMTTVRFRLLALRWQCSVAANAALLQRVDHWFESNHCYKIENVRLRKYLTFKIPEMAQLDERIRLIHGRFAGSSPAFGTSFFENFT